MTLPLEPPIDPMLAKLTRSLPTGDLLYEPKWDGFRCLVFRDGDEVQLQSRNGKPFARYFPELLDPAREQLPERIVLDGEIVVPIRSDGVTQLDFDALSQRIHPAESRVQMLSRQTPARYVAFDLLAVGDEDLMRVPLRERRERLERELADVRRPLSVTPATTDAERAADWFERFEGAGLDGVIAKGLDGTYQPGKRVLQKVKHERTADCVVAGYRIHKDGKGVGSLLLGLYDHAGRLRHIGVAASFRAEQRRELLEDLAPLTRDVEDHPWIGSGEGADATPMGQNRWNASKDTSWEPIRIERVVEVAYDQLEGDRLRHTARFKRWRPDRDPESCTYEQLDVPPPLELSEVFDA